MHPIRVKQERANPETGCALQFEQNEVYLFVFVDCCDHFAHDPSSLIRNKPEEPAKAGFFYVYQPMEISGKE